MGYGGSDKHKIKLFELFAKKQDKLTAGDNIALTPLQDGTVRIDADGGGDVTDVQVDGVSILDDGVANITTMRGATAQANGAKGLVPAPTTVDKDKCLKGDGTWGEAGKVDDVQMNGQSIVDANKVARFNNYVELTRAEYDALPDSKYTDGILYCIKDSGSSNAQFFSPIVYSLAEREVGVWIDGKPLYQKSYFIPNPVYLTTTGSGTPSFTPTAVQDATMASIDKVVSITGHWTRRSDYGSGTVYDLVYPINAWETTNIFRSLVRVNTTAPSQAEIGWNYCIYTDNNISVAKNLFVTVQYTKTTDTPGTGKWAQDGVPAVHRSTDEKVIGTWIDGSTLYEKTYIITGGANTGDTVFDSSFANNAKTMISYTGHFINSISLNCLGLPYINTNDNITCVFQSGTNGLCLRVLNANWPSTVTFYITVQYTKSS